MTPNPGFEHSALATWPRSRLVWLEFGILGILPLLVMGVAPADTTVGWQPWLRSLVELPWILGMLGLLVITTWWSGTPLRHIGLTPKWNRQTTEAAVFTTLAALVLWWVPCHALHLFPAPAKNPILAADVIGQLVSLASEALLTATWAAYNWNRASELMPKPYAFVVLVGLNSLGGFWDSPLCAAMFGVLSAVFYASIIRWRSVFGVALAVMVARLMPIFVP